MRTVVVVAVMLFPLSPVTWDPSLCRNSAFASAHRDLCGDPILNNSGGGSGGGGILGTIGRVLGGLTGGLL